jgi:putative glutamine amidotransferase
MTRGGRADEWAESLADEWPPVLRRFLAGIPWVAIPNVGSEVTRFIRSLGVSGIVLTGGNDVGACPERDETERRLIEDCILARRPILGVCRGLQMLQTHFGGRLRTASGIHDRGRMHGIRICAPSGSRWLGRQYFRAPSFHRHGVAAPELAAPLEAWAISEDGLVEGLRHRDLPIVAVQWHPERPLPEVEVAVRLLRSFVDGWRG